MHRSLLCPLLLAVTLLFHQAECRAARIGSDHVPGRYLPVKGGFQIKIKGTGPVAPVESATEIGTVVDNPRLHRRPLFPPADKTLIWTQEQLGQLERCSFRPLVVAYNEPRFLFDFHSAGGLLGHLQVGLKTEGESKWFHQWENLEVAYNQGRMEYHLEDPAFPGVGVNLAALPLADSAGLALKVQLAGAPEGAQLVWGYGGASAFFTAYSMNAPEFTFSPEQCSKDRYEFQDGQFTLHRAFDDSDLISKEGYAASRHLKDWEAVVSGGSSWQAPIGAGSPEKFAFNPADLAGTLQTNKPGADHRDCVAVQTVPAREGSLEGFIVVGMGGNITEAIGQPSEAWKAGLDRNREIATRVTIQTPDPYLNSAVTLLAFATEGTWGDLAILHGAWSWRFAYLGWRGWYGSNCYGWTDRVKKSIQNHTSLGLVREGPDRGALSSLLEFDPGVYYNMNEVFFDQTRQYFDYTNDLELMREIFPVLEGILAWENRRLQPGGESLYENSLNTWISDSHWYIRGQCTQASAYMLRAHSFMADLAKRLGQDPAPFAAKAEAIRGAMQAKLWMDSEGVFAEYLDTRGNRLLHPQPELPTLYHSAEFGAADAHQIERMLDWARVNLRQESTPGGGKLYWSSNWFPNHGRSYTHSTYEMAYAEELNFALTQYLAGRSEEAYALIRATLCGIFNGPTPGGLSCHSQVDGRQRANDEFADAISMWGRTLVEGLFGIVPKRPDGVVELSPQIPADWQEATIQSPQLSYVFRRGSGLILIEWVSPVETSVRLRLPIRGDSIDQALVDNQPVEATLELLSATQSWVSLQTPVGTKGKIHVEFSSIKKRAPNPPPVAEELEEPQAVWSSPEAGQKDLSRWIQVDLTEVFNASVTEVLKRVTEAAIPPDATSSQVGFGYWKDHLLQYHGSRNQPISDAAWRAKVGPDGIAWTTDGIPFKTSRDGNNIGVVTLAGGFPGSLDIPVQAEGKTLYLMIGGMTFPAQSHVPNLRVTLSYRGGALDSKDLINPVDIGDCWSTWCGRYHDTAANGFENIGGRSGPAGSIEVKDLAQPVVLDTEAHLLAFPLREGESLEKITLEAVANDVIFGVMGATVLK